MKKIFICIILSTLFLSCKDKETLTENPVIKKEVLPEPKLNFEIEEVSRNNILLNNNPHIKLEISDFPDLSDLGENEVYKIELEGKDSQKHQVLDSDFNFCILENGKYINITAYNINKESDYKNLYIKPLKAGSYALNFKLQKYNTKSNNYIGKSAVQSILFNCVKVYFRFPSEMISKANIIKWHRDYRRMWFLKLDDGKQPTDTYLSNYDLSKEYILETNYDGDNRKTTNYKVGNEHKFRWDYDSESDPINYRDSSIFPKTMNITVTQKLKNGRLNIIEYKNVKVY